MSHSPNALRIAGPTNGRRSRVGGNTPLKLRSYWPGVGVGLSVGVGLAAVAAASGLAVGVAVAPTNVLGVSIRPIISLTGCFVRNLVSVQRFCIIPGIFPYYDTM